MNHVKIKQMKSNLLFITVCSFLLNICVVNMANSQNNNKLFCFPEASFVGIKTDNNLTDYFEYEICNSSQKTIIGIIVSYDEFYKPTPNKEICRVKTSIIPNVKKKVKVYLPYNFDGYKSYNIQISRFIYSDGTSKDAVFLGNI